MDDQERRLHEFDRDRISAANNLAARTQQLGMVLPDLAVTRARLEALIDHQLGEHAIDADGNTTECAVGRQRFELRVLALLSEQLELAAITLGKRPSGLVVPHA